MSRRNSQHWASPLLATVRMLLTGLKNAVLPPTPPDRTFQAKMRWGKVRAVEGGEGGGLERKCLVAMASVRRQVVLAPRLFTPALGVRCQTFDLSTLRAYRDPLECVLRNSLYTEYTHSIRQFRGETHNINLPYV